MEYRIRVLFWLEEIIKFSHKSSTTESSTTPFPLAPYLHVFQLSLGMMTLPLSLDSASQCLAICSMKIFFIISNLNLPCHKLWSFSLVVMLITWRWARQHGCNSLKQKVRNHWNLNLLLPIWILYLAVRLFLGCPSEGLNTMNFWVCNGSESVWLVDSDCRWD